MQVTESQEFLEWSMFQRHLMAIEQVIIEHGFNWCSDEYPTIEILDSECRLSLAKFKFEGFEQLESELSKL